MSSEKTAFPIVGIGASAGGLEALEQFLPQISTDSGMAFVVVQHLDPHRNSMLTEILQRLTVLPVTEAVDDALIVPNHIYIIPPNRDMSIFHGKLQVSWPAESYGPRLAIDTFLQSLAEDQRENAAGIILSGTGSDGTKGLGAILNAGGMTLVQEPTTAKYDGMPSSAIHAGYATYVLPADKMPAVLQSKMGKIDATEQAVIKGKDASHTKKTQGINHVLMYLRNITGHDFSLYKKSTIERRIERRMVHLDIEEMDVYEQFLKKNTSEVTALFKELLINVTSFFRDKEAFELLQKEILPDLCKDKTEQSVFRAWVAGCASGEEVYSIAILLKEWMKENHHEFKVQIYGTDLDEEAIVFARMGVYPETISQDITPQRLQRFFTEVVNGYRIKKEIREIVVFALQNVLKDPPFTKLDLLSCRNLLIYLGSELQNQLIPTFHYALKPGGVLFLSPSEGIGNHTELFSAINRKWKFYCAMNLAATRPLMPNLLSWTTEIGGKVLQEVMKPTEINFAELTRRALVQCYAPASVVTDLKGTILFVHGDTGKFLRLAPGRASLNVIEMAHNGLEVELRTAIRAANDGNPTLSREIQVKTEIGFAMINLSVRLLTGNESNQKFLLISFQEITSPTSRLRKKRLDKPVELDRIDELDHELVHLKENYQVSLEEQQASNEELKSTNEELQSTNEELQSTNEELETSKEELQSINEELVTVNSELQGKIEQLVSMQNDMKNLLDNTHIGTVFLDDQMTIRRFTQEATYIYRLAPSDVGRTLSDIRSNLRYEELLAKAQTVLETLIPLEEEVQTENGNWYLARIQPYRTLDNAIEGVVMTFLDISKLNKAETAMRLARDLADSVVDTIIHPLLIIDGDLMVISSNQAFYQFFKVTAADTIGRKIYDIGNGQWNFAALRRILEIILPHEHVFEGFVEHDFPDIGTQKLLLNARRLVGPASELTLILLITENIDSLSIERKKSQ